MSHAPKPEVLLPLAEKLVVDSQLRVVAVGDAFLAATALRREDLVGKRICDVCRLAQHGEPRIGGGASTVVTNERLELLGRLAVGLAHDLQNLMTVVSMNAELAMFAAPLESATWKHGQQIQAAARMASAMTQHLLQFAVAKAGWKQALDVRVVLADMLAMVQRLLPSGIGMTVEADHDLGEVWADASRLNQLVLNLLMNARDAMPDGGALRFAMRRLHLEGPPPDVRPGLPAGRYVLLSVADSGIGMDEATLQKMFDPFFSTKEHGRGSGLGLATVASIVAEHRGGVRVTSRLREGTTVEVLLPEAGGPPGAAASPSAAGDGP